MLNVKVFRNSFAFKLSLSTIDEIKLDNKIDFNYYTIIHYVRIKPIFAAEPIPD